MAQIVELPRVGGPGTGSGGLWRVIVLNDDFNTFDHVAETLARVIPGSGSTTRG
jgi:ATP-dependent Clp protease adaptor protein ClpS